MNNNRAIIFESRVADCPCENPVLTLTMMIMFMFWHKINQFVGTEADVENGTDNTEMDEGDASDDDEEPNEKKFKT